MSELIRPYVVGEENAIVVGLEGVIESISEDGITIGGITMPTRLDYARGVRYVSMVWPEDNCTREHCGDDCISVDAYDPDEDVRDDLKSLLAVIEARHNERHMGAWRFCGNTVCRAASEVIPDA